MCKADSEKHWIEELQSRINHGHLQTIQELEETLKEEKLDLNPYEDILCPMGWNTCDRCGLLCDTDLDLLWIDGFPWDEDNPEDEAILKGLQEENNDYTAICWTCAKNLRERNKR